MSAKIQKDKLASRMLVFGCIAIFASLVIFYEQQSKPVSYAQEIFDLCYDDDECMIDMMYGIGQKESREDVLYTVDDLVDMYVDANFYCHPSAHHLGEFLFGYVNRNLSTVSHIADHRCAAGIMHGLVENTIQIENILDGKSIDEVDIREPCERIRASLGEEAKKECIHGMGHSLIKSYNYDTVSASERCNEFDGWREIYMCNGGIFMQNIAEYAKNKKGDFVSLDMYHPCNKIDGTKNKEAATLCYRYQANYFLSQAKYDLHGAYSMCSGIDDSRYIAVCYKGISAHLTKDNFEDIDSTQKMCLATPIKFQEACVVGAVESLTRFVSEDKASEFCDGLEDNLNERCVSRMNSLLDDRF